jgi:hypothetical protein
MRVILILLPFFVVTSLHAQSKNAKPDLSGKHKLTLQWISFTEPGSVVFKKTAKDNYSIEGEQLGRKGCDSCYVKISGKVVCADAKTLKFTGRIETSVDILSAGEPCIKEGEYIFKATGTRKYWRCQDMKSCGNETSYVDIYFK